MINTTIGFISIIICFSEIRECEQQQNDIPETAQLGDIKGGFNTMDGYIVIETDKYYSKGREELFTIDYPFTDRFDPDVVLKEHEKIRQRRMDRYHETVKDFPEQMRIIFDAFPLECIDSLWCKGNDYAFTIVLSDYYRKYRYTSEWEYKKDSCERINYIIKRLIQMKHNKNSAKKSLMINESPSAMTSELRGLVIAHARKYRSVRDQKIIIKASMGDCTLSGDCLW